MKRTLEVIEQDPTRKEAGEYARILNGETLELQRLNLDETALTLIIRKDMSDSEYKKHRDLRRDRQERINTALRKAAQWIKKIPPLADGRIIELSLLTSNNVPDINEEYGATIVQATIDQEEAETIQRIQEEEEVHIREVSPEPGKHQERQTSTPNQPTFPQKREESHLTRVNGSTPLKKDRRPDVLNRPDLRKEMGLTSTQGKTHI